MCLVKNEADIIAECLLSAAKWCDAIYVYDNGSDDGTWEIVISLARTVGCLIPFKQDNVPFRDSIRGEIFERYRHQSTQGEWWCRLDADEFYIDDPRTFLAEVPPSFDVVWSAKFQYYFTEQELARYELDPHAFDDGVPVAQKCRHYLNNWSEPRFFRYHPQLSYREGDWPRPLGPSFPERIRVKHFQYRSPSQISKRLATRREPMVAGMFRHETVPDWSMRIALRLPGLPRSISSYRPASWRERIADSRYLLIDDGTGTYNIDRRALPPVRQLS